MTSKIVRKTIEEAQNVQNAEIDFSDKNLIHLDDMPIVDYEKCNAANFES